jgi:hypothetical protein
MSLFFPALFVLPQGVQLLKSLLGRSCRDK